MEMQIENFERENTISKEDIKKLIYTVRGKQVMLDNDVAMLFKYETKDLNRNVRNNIERFPEYYCFQLTEEEYKSLRCKNFTLDKSGRGQHRKYLPFVFTEHGITMLAGLLKSKIAVNISIKIVNSFIDIMKRASNKILIIDNYVDDTILKMLTKKNKNVEVQIVTSNKCNIQNIDVQKFNKEYPTLKIDKTDKFHDRFIIIDDKEMYHCGASIKDVGRKCFAITKIEDINIISKLISETLLRKFGRY